MTLVLDNLDSVEGPVLAPGDPGYDAEVTGFNVAVRSAPVVAVGATSAADVAAAVRYAAARGLRVVVRATGHGPTDDMDGAVLVSTRRMDGVTVNAAAGVARAEAGVRWRAVLDAAAPHGLAPLVGASSQVGVVGYTTGGGIGPLARRYGFAADRVRRFTIVTADGAVRAVDADSEPDLFWAVRGGRGAFGIVTDIDVDLVPQPRLFGGGIFFPAEDAARLLHAWPGWAACLGEDTSTSIALLALPPDENLPPMLRGRTVAHLRFTHLGSAEEGAALLAPMRELGTPLMDGVGELPFAAVDAVHADPTDPMPVWDRGLSLDALPAEAIDALLDRAGPQASSPLVVLELRLLGGALARPAAVPNAVSGRNGAFGLYCLGVLAGADQAAAVRARGTALIDALAPWASRGGLVNFAGEGRTADLWDDDVRVRLAAVKRRWDPAGVFGHSL